MFVTVLAFCGDNNVITTIRTIITGRVEIFFWHFNLYWSYG